MQDRETNEQNPLDHQQVSTEPPQIVPQIETNPQTSLEDPKIVSASNSSKIDAPASSEDSLVQVQTDPLPIADPGTQSSEQNQEQSIEPSQPQGQWQQNQGTGRPPHSEQPQGQWQAQPPHQPQGQWPQQPIPVQPTFIQTNPMPTDPNSQAEYSRIRNFITACQITALISLIFGGVVLSSVSIGLGIYARYKANAVFKKKAGNLDARQSTPQMLRPDVVPWFMLRRSATIAIIMAVIALGLNVISLISILPMVNEVLQSGDYGSVFGGAQGGGTGSGSSAW